MEIIMNVSVKVGDPLFTQKKKYREQLYAAKQRGIEWQYTFETWWQQWSDSGKWDLRGNKRGQWCMGRRGDTGPYSPDNVDIIPAQQNAVDAQKVNYGPAARRGKTNIEMYGKERAAEIAELFRQQRTGTKQSAATCLKKSQTNKGRPWTAARRQAEIDRKKATSP